MQVEIFLFSCGENKYRFYYVTGTLLRAAEADSEMNDRGSGQFVSKQVVPGPPAQPSTVAGGMWAYCVRHDYFRASAACGSGLWLRWLRSEDSSGDKQTTPPKSLNGRHLDES